MSNPRIAIIGGGVSGAAAAYYLSRSLSQAQIDVFEANDYLGGKLHESELAGERVEVGAEAFLAIHNKFAELIQQLGMEEDLVTSSSYTSAIYNGHECTSIPRSHFMGIPASGEEYIDILGHDGAALVNAESTLPPLEWIPGEDMTVAQLVEPRYGRPVIDKLITPLQGGVYASDADSLGVRATLPALAQALDTAAESGEQIYLSHIITKMLEDRAKKAPARSGKKPAPVFKTLQHGFEPAVEAMTHQPNVHVHLNTPVLSVNIPQDRTGTWNVTYAEHAAPKATSHSRTGEYDAVVVALPAVQAARLMHIADAEDAEDSDAQQLISALESIDLSSVAVVAMHSSDEDILPEYSGVLFQGDSGTESKAMTFSSRKWIHIAEKGGSTLRVSFGSFTNTQVLEQSDDELVQAALRDFETITGQEFIADSVYVQRWSDGLPNYAPRHSEAVSEIQQCVELFPTLSLIGSSYHGVGIPACVTLAEKAMKELISTL